MWPKQTDEIQTLGGLGGHPGGRSRGRGLPANKIGWYTEISQKYFFHIFSMVRLPNGNIYDDLNTAPQYLKSNFVALATLLDV